MDTASVEKIQSLKTLTTVVYGLYAASFFVGITAIVAIIVNYVKLDDARGTWLESHFRWQIVNQINENRARVEEILAAGLHHPAPRLP